MEYEPEVGKVDDRIDSIPKEVSQRDCVRSFRGLSPAKRPILGQRWLAQHTRSKRDYHYSIDE